MENKEKLSEQESLELITTMIQKAKNSYYESGTSVLLWGSVTAIASFVTFLQQTMSFQIGFDIWILLFIAIIPQIFISIKERKQRKFKSHTDIAINAVWLTYGVTIAGVVLYHNIVPYTTNDILIKTEGWHLVKHYIANNKPDEIIRPFVPSFFSMYLLVFAMPTLVTGIVKKFVPMIIGAIITYALFLGSLFTPFKYDMLFGTITAIVCWLIPGIILRKRYYRQKNSDV
jgi:hypothetical protein